MKRPVSRGPPADDFDADLRLGTALFSHLPFADAMLVPRRFLVGNSEAAHRFFEGFARNQGDLHPAGKAQPRRDDSATLQGALGIGKPQSDGSMRGFAGTIEPVRLLLGQGAVDVAAQHAPATEKTQRPHHRPQGHSRPGKQLGAESFAKLVVQRAQ